MKIAKHKCPRCGIVSTDKDFDDGNEMMSYESCFISGVMKFECFECGNTWEENIK